MAKPDSSPRQFGLVIGGILLVLGLEPALFRHLDPRYWAVVLGAALVIAAALAPKLLSPLDKAWRGLALLLHRLTNPIIMGLIYIGAFLPMGLMVKIGGKELLGRRWEPRDSYWVERKPLKKGSMSKQF